MYEFRPISDRIERLRVKVRDRVIIADASKERIRLDAQQKYYDFPPILERAYVTKYIIDNMHYEIRDDEFLAGDLGNKNWGDSHGLFWVLAGDVENTWPIGEDGLHHAPEDDPKYSLQKLAIAPEDVKIMKEIIAEKMAVYGKQKPEEWLPDGAREFYALQASDYGKIGGWPTHLRPGHLTPGFQNLLRDGYGKIRRQAREWLDAHEGNMQGADMGKYIFYKAAEVSCDAAITMTQKYAEAARKRAAEAATPELKKEYEEMAEALDWAATQPAGTFFEALQQVMMYNCFLKTDNDPGVTSLGRFDQYTWPYLKKDLEEGRITMEHAQELVDSFFLKVNVFYQGGFGKTQQTAGIGHLGQHTTIGGQIPETGEDAVNPVSYMVLEAMARLQLHEPTVSLRVTDNTPKEMWDCAMVTSTKVGGLPLLQNDNVIVPALQRELGFTLEDARNFAFIGCQEITGSGNDYPAPNGSAMGHSGIYWAIVLDMVINNGVNPMNGASTPERLKFGYLPDFKTYEELLAAYEKTCDWMLTWSASLNNFTEHEYYRLYPLPNLSITTEGCMESGKDVSEGGAKYNSYGGTATGLATSADSLTAIKYMVYDKKIVDAQTYLDAVLANWEGTEYEALRQRVLHEVPHYGNNDPYADEQMKYMIDLYYNLSRKYHTERAKVYKCGTFGASDHVVQGEITWATPDGRKTGEPIADASSPAQGRDTNGPTSVFNSSTFFDHSHFMDGMALNLKIHPTSLRGEEGLTKLENLTKAYFDEGGMEVQYNVVDAKTLRKAQEHPEDYHNLVVRIAGFSAYFVDMTPAMQEDIISRNEQSI